MRIVNLDKCELGVELGGTVYDGLGVPVFVRGVKLTKDMKKLLKRNGVSHVYVNDGISDGIESSEFIPQEVRGETIRLLNEKFVKVSVRQVGYSEKDIAEIEKVFNNLYEAFSLNKCPVNLLSTIKVHDRELYAHSVNVSLYSMHLAREMGFGIEALKNIGLGAILHDIGKMFIPSSILYKNTQLTDEEYEIIKTHSSLGYEVLKKHLPFDSAQSAYQHHERLDGSGYPRGLKGEEIHPFAKILAVADVFDAVTSNRIYQEAVLPHEGLKILQKSSPHQLDSNLVKTFPKAIAVYPPGLIVNLNTGQKAIVKKYNSDSPNTPVVRVFTEENGMMLKEPFEVDLKESSTFNIVSSEV